MQTKKEYLLESFITNFPQKNTDLKRLKKQALKKALVYMFDNPTPFV